MSERQRFVALAVSMVTIVSVLAGLLVFLNRKDDERAVVDPPTSKRVELTETQKREVDLAVRNFVFVTGNWGVRANQVNSETVEQFSRLSGSSSRTNFFDDRSTVYERSRKFILKGSPIDYDASVVNSWEDRIAFETLSTFKVESVEAEVPDEGELEGENSPKLTVTVRADFQVLQTRRVNLVDDATNPVVFTVDEKSFDNRATLTIVQEGGDWKVSNVEDVTYPFTMTTWKTPEDYNEEQFDFVRVGELESKPRG